MGVSAISVLFCDVTRPTLKTTSALDQKLLQLLFDAQLLLVVRRLKQFTVEHKPRSMLKQAL